VYYIVEIALFIYYLIIDLGPMQKFFALVHVDSGLLGHDTM